MEKNLKDAERYLTKAEYARSQGWDTAYDVTINAASAIIQCVRFCVKCSKRKRRELGDKFKCEGCMGPGMFEKFEEHNKRIWYVLHWTRRHDTRYK
jgi:hypothetical protein